MAGNTFTPAAGTTYFNKTGPNQGVTAGPVRSATNAISPQATYAAGSQGVLGASTGPSQNAGPASPNYINNAPQIPQPQQPSIDFDALIAPALAGLDAAIQPLQDQSAANVSSINTNAQSQKDQTNQSIAAQTGTINQAQTQQKQNEQSASDAARRQYSEIQQGLQARYGGTTGTGAFATEQAGTQTLRSMADIKTNAANAQTGLSDKLQQVQEVGRTALQNIDSQTQDQIAKEKANLETQLADIRNQKGQLMAHKAELASQAIQQYQATVNSVNQQNAQFKQQLYVQQQQAQAQLQAALEHANNIASAATPEALMQYVQSLQPLVNAGYSPTVTQGIPASSGGGSISLSPTKNSNNITGDPNVDKGLGLQ